MQSTKYLLLLLAVLAFAAMNAAAPGDNYLNEPHAKDCTKYGKPNAKMNEEDVRKCNACCILVGELYRFIVKYEMAYEPSTFGLCICMRSGTTKVYDDKEIREFKELLGRRLDVIDLNSPTASYNA
jgi:hypothetical protein